MIYKRFLLKLSGEVLSGVGVCYCAKSFDKICHELADLYHKGLQIGLVVGGGNICRGERSNLGIGRVNADYMGMTATITNALALQGYLQNIKIPAKIYSSIPLNGIVERFDRRRVLKHFAKNDLIIFAGGTGHPFFTTDTAAVLRAIESKCDAVLKGTHVDGIYSADPKKDTGAKRYDKITYQDVIDQNLKIMDITAISLAKEHNLPILIFNINGKNELTNVLNGAGRYTVIE